MDAAKRARVQSMFPPAGWGSMSPRGRMRWLKDADGLVASGAVSRTVIEKERNKIDRQRAKMRQRMATYAQADDWYAGWPFPPVPDDPTLAMRTADVTLSESREGDVLWPAIYLSRVVDRKTGPVSATYDVVCMRTAELEAELDLNARPKRWAIPGDRMAAAGLTKVGKPLALRSEVIQVLKREIEAAKKRPLRLARLDRVKGGYAVRSEVGGVVVDEWEPNEIEEYEQ